MYADRSEGYMLIGVRGIWLIGVRGICPDYAIFIHMSVHALLVIGDAIFF